MKNFVFLMMHLLAAATAKAAPFVRPCSDAPSHADQRACLEAQFKQIDSDLMRTEKNELSRIDGWAEEPNYRKTAREHFMKSAKAFRKYRTTQCEYFLSLAAGAAEPER